MYHDVPRFIAEAADADEYEHSGGESGVNSDLRYDLSGNGFVHLLNSDLDDDSLETVDAARVELLAPEAGLEP